MKRLANLITRFLFGVDCYPVISSEMPTPTFKTLIPDGYDGSLESFNRWARTVNVSCQYYSKHKTI